MAAADRKPYTLKAPRPQRESNGQFAREVPPNPLSEEAAGTQPQRWAPGIGQNTAPSKGPTIPWQLKAPTANPFRSR